MEALLNNACRKELFLLFVCCFLSGWTTGNQRPAPILNYHSNAGVSKQFVGKIEAADEMIFYSASFERMK
jgi:hypothetical protein